MSVNFMGNYFRIKDLFHSLGNYNFLSLTSLVLIEQNILQLSHTKAKLKQLTRQITIKGYFYVNAGILLI